MRELNIWNEKGGLRDVIEHSIANTPRSLQQTIGPSELGMPCTRRLIHKLTGTREADQASRWKAEVGTAIHARLAGVFEAIPDKTRYLIEQKVAVGHIRALLVEGSCDLFDVDAGVVVDWKSTSLRNMAAYRRNGPGQQYRTQAHLYGRGFRLLGYPVHNVMLVFLPRDGELGETYVWTEPFNEQIATDALARAAGLVELVEALGRPAVLEMYPECTDVWCSVCESVRAPFGAVKKALPGQPANLHSVAELFGAQSVGKTA